MLSAAEGVVADKSRKAPWIITGGTFHRGSNAEESPDKAGHPAAESAGGSNLTRAVTENNRRTRPPRVKTRGKSSRPSVATPAGYGTRTCKTKYTGR